MGNIDLKGLRCQREKVEFLKERIIRLRSAMEYTERRFKEAPRDKFFKDRLLEDMAKLDELERQLIDEVIVLEDDISNAERILDNLPEQQQRVMRLRYIEGLGWRQVARKSHYSERHCYRIHKAAIKRIDKKCQ